jgi:ATP-dependent RNA helicase DDX55/SPB4
MKGFNKKRKLPNASKSLAADVVKEEDHNDGVGDDDEILEMKSGKSSVIVKRPTKNQQHGRDKKHQPIRSSKNDTTATATSTATTKQDTKSTSTSVDASKSKKNSPTQDDTTDIELDPHSTVNMKPKVQQQQQQKHIISFENFRNPRPLSQGVIAYVQQQQFTYMTPVQIATIPQFLSYKDVAVQSVTGSGKTLAFLIPILELLQNTKMKLKSQQIGALVLSPTRELAQQTYVVAKELCICCQQPEPLLLVGGGSSSGSSSSSSTNNSHGGSNNKNNTNSSTSNSRPVTLDVTTFQQLGSNLIIGTPGRVNDILSRYAIMDCSELLCLVLDEADVLLNMGFTTTLQMILSHLPKMRRTALFSATQSSSTSTTLSEWMVRVGMRNPIWIDVTIVAPTGDSVDTKLKDTESSVSAVSESALVPSKSEKTKKSILHQATPLSLQNYYIVTKMDEKISRLAAFVQDHGRHEKVIVFFLTCACVDYYGTLFQQLFSESKIQSKKKKKDSNDTNYQMGGNDNDDDNTTNNSRHIIIEMLHGKMVQKRREKTMERFRMCCDNDNESKNDSSAAASVGPPTSRTNGIVLFCTDVAARGLDVTDIHWVVQVDAPQDPSFFIHRVGRCARAGKIGQSLILLSPKEESYIDFLRMRNIPIDLLPNTERCCPPSVQDAAVVLNPTIVGKTSTDDSAVMTKQRTILSANTGLNDGIIDDILPKMYHLVTKDRDILEKGTKAFTSYIRAYKEHHCAFIFRYVVVWCRCCILVFSIDCIL